MHIYIYIYIYIYIVGTVREKKYIDYLEGKRLIKVKIKKKTNVYTRT